MLLCSILATGVLNAYLSLFFDHPACSEIAGWDNRDDENEDISLSVHYSNHFLRSSFNLPTSVRENPVRTLGSISRATVVHVHARTIFVRLCARSAMVRTVVQQLCPSINRRRITIPRTQDDGTSERRIKCTTLFCEASTKHHSIIVYLSRPFHDGNFSRHLLVRSTRFIKLPSWTPSAIRWATDGSRRERGRRSRHFRGALQVVHSRARRSL